MLKRIFWLRPAIIAGMIGLTLVNLLQIAAVAGVYNLEYPAGYGCKCRPNSAEFGYFRTQWRQWPGEERLDQNHPKAIGAEKLPPVQGFEPLPLPRVKLQDLQPKGTTPGPEGPGTTPGPMTPTIPRGPEAPEGPAVPGGENLPKLPPEPGGFTPPPGLPPDTNFPGLFENKDNQPTEPPKGTAPTTEPSKDTPAPTDKDKKENPPADQPKDTKPGEQPAVGGLRFKTDSPKKGASDQRNLNHRAESAIFNSETPTRLPETASAKPVAELSQPGVYAEAFRSGTIYPSTDASRRADYETPIEGARGGSPARDVVQQSFQQSLLPEARPSAIRADSDLAAPPLGLKGYCPVELCRGGRWVQGDPRWTVIHQGVTYRLSGNEQRLQFLARPEQFTPANGGMDLVVWVHQQRQVPGELSYCAAFKGRLYMFSSADTQLEFQKNPERYLGTPTNTPPSNERAGF